MISDFTSDEFNIAKNTLLKYMVSPLLTQSEQPQCFFIVGQPGSGKTILADIFAKYLGEDVIFINGDDYRKQHPRYNELQKEYGDKAVLHTQKFAGAMTEALIEELSDRKYNLIIEGTLRTVDVPVKTKMLLEQKGYRSTLVPLLVRPEISYLSTIKRYAMMKEFGTVPRQTPKEHHDLVVTSIINNLDKIYKEKLFNNIQIYTRDSVRIYNSQETPQKNPAKIFRDEFCRKLSTNEKNLIIHDYSEYVKKNEILEVLKQYKKQYQEFKI